MTPTHWSCRLGMHDLQPIGLAGVTVCTRCGKRHHDFSPQKPPKLHAAQKAKRLAVGGTITQAN
jgi:hypothetical protein